MSTKEDLNKLYEIIEKMQFQLELVKEIVVKLQAQDRYDSLKDIPGIEGKFDGKYLVTSEGERIEVPANYASKSRIVYGDTLKMYEENGRKMFKQLIKLPRRKVLAVLSKKEGKFYALSEFGDHEISSTSVEHNNLSVGDQIQIILPEENLKAPFTTLDKTLQQEFETNNSVSNKNLNTNLKKDTSSNLSDTSYNNVKKNTDNEKFINENSNNNRNQKNNTKNDEKKNNNLNNSNKSTNILDKNNKANIYSNTSSNIQGDYQATNQRNNQGYSKGYNQNVIMNNKSTQDINLVSDINSNFNISQSNFNNDKNANKNFIPLNSNYNQDLKLERSNFEQGDVDSNQVIKSKTPLNSSEYDLKTNFGEVIKDLTKNPKNQINSDKILQDDDLR